MCDGFKFVKLYQGICKTFLKEIKNLLEYSQLWWSIKQDSYLNQFLDEFLEQNTVFILDDLIAAFKSKAYSLDLYEKGNSFIIHLTPALQACFNVPIATVDDLPSMIIDHVYVLDKHECLEYQQNFVSENLSILLDDKLIYDDPLSLFWEIGRAHV